MSSWNRLLAFSLIIAVGLLPACILPPRTIAPVPVLVFRDVSVFDGRTLIPRCSVVVRGSTIAAVGQDVTVPHGAEVISGQGLTLLPGLIDSHVHAFAPGDLERSLMFGVTTVLDMTTTVDFMRQVKARQSADGALGMADLLSAGAAATVPGGHGTEYGVDVPTLTEVGEAAAFVAARKAEGSDYLKIMSGAGRRVLNKEVIAALAAEAGKLGLLSVVHINTQKYAREAVEGGVNGLAHCFADTPPEEGLISLMRDKNAFVIPTLSVMTDLADARKADLVHDPRIVPYLPPELLEALAERTSLSNSPGLTYRVAEETAGRLHRAGIKILAGSDSGNPGTLHGPSLHGELELLVAAGLGPLEALAAATSVPAGVFGLEDRGRIAPGLRADLVLVKGYPDKDIAATRDIVGVWKLGRRLDRGSFRARMMGLQKSWKETGKLPPPVGSESGLISDFDSGNTFTRFGFVWFATNDARQGGRSRAAIGLAGEGAGGSAGSLSIWGELQPGGPMPWAGAAFYPGPTVWTCADLSAWNGISFWARGTAAKAVLIFVLKGKKMPAFQLFDVGQEWRKVEISFAKMGGTEGRDILTMVLGAAQGQGPFTLGIDQVRLIRLPAAE